MAASNMAASNMAVQRRTFFATLPNSYFVRFSIYYVWQTTKKRTKRVTEVLEIDSDEDGGISAVYIPNENDSGSSDSESDSDEQDPSNSPNKIPNVSYHKVLHEYEENQSILEPNHEYSWVSGEKKYTDILEDKNLHSDKTKNMIQKIKNYIVECTQENGYPLTLQELHVFLGIILLSIINIRKSQKDYWSNKLLLGCNLVKSAMSRNKFLKIKCKIKLSKAEDQNSNDKAWKVRKVLEIYRKNCLQFGFFSTALAIDEMMVKFYGRTNLLQFLPNKPDRFGLKIIGIASPAGYLFDCDIYCGQGSQVYSADKKLKLSKCSLGSCFVMLMVQKLLTSVVPRKIMQYHVWFDNYFTSPDLLVHLHNLGLKATGTVRVNRVKVKNNLDKKAERGTFIVQHEKNSGMIL
ncbi:piggyBac transposable element-derived protein 3-like [Phymastichus coffea]|uniref:piggyBac transposable element-derived protein 3-like n=1 Tax=Phymastichus coffea TaxID=108790 RepID=UPI00273B49F1|nr:piggyBac transposable element-derived protein 3-like [Phymastichus coffea]